MDLPRDYVSPSQVIAFEEGQWLDRYYYKKEMFLTDEIKLGKMFSEALEGKLVSRKDVQQVADVFKLSLPKGGKFESVAITEPCINYENKEFFFDIENGKIKLYGKIDYETDDYIYEFKTGHKKWSQLRADLHIQIPFYQLIRYINNEPLKNGRLVWIETDENNQFTGDWHVYEVPFDLDKLADTRRRIIRYLNWAGNHIEKPPLILK